MRIIQNLGCGVKAQRLSNRAGSVKNQLRTKVGGFTMEGMANTAIAIDLQPFYGLRLPLDNRPLSRVGA
jgi:hypothetical protein